MMRKRTNPTAGFSLVEIMIVVAIIGVLAAMAIPNFVKEPRSDRVGQATMGIGL
jgi:prepilin-type N-terminal cleavage/methylation domain-containing protein